MELSIMMIWSLVTGIVATLVYAVTGKRSKKPTVDQALLRDHHWSLNEDKVDETVYNFTISVGNDVLDDLRSRLSNTRIFESFQGTNFEYGMQSNVLKRIIYYWQHEYDWRRVEGELNQLPHFKTTIEGLSIHYIHVKAKQPTRDTLPILMVHGWPGSFYEFVKSIPYLEDDFNLVIPSLPGYGFSEPPEKPGCSVGHVARILNKLMRRLGYSRFVYQGGDWGSSVGHHMAMLYPKDVIGLHVNMPNSGRSASQSLKLILAYFMPNIIHNDPGIIDEQKISIVTLLRTFWVELGFFHLQATKPDTVGYALNDSPAGLAAYILEKFSSLTKISYINEADGGLFEKFSLDDLLTNVTIYWINGNITSSVRLYKETLTSMPSFYVQVPAGLCPGRHELINYPRSFLDTTYANIIHYNNKIDAGHFLFFESPKEATDDLKVFVQKLRPLM